MCDNNKTIPFQEDLNKKLMSNSLLPVEISPDSAAYHSVDELNDVIELAKKEKRIRNIALTGPFGSGKSSILYTLRKNHPDTEYLTISLATLCEKEPIKENDTDNRDHKYKKKSLYRNIEYSILQQIIYKEKSTKVPNSRFKRIIHYDKKELAWKVFTLFVFVLAFCITFEPNAFRIETLCDFFDLGKWNIVGDFFSLFIMLFILYRPAANIISILANSKLNKLNLKDGVVELEKDTSIFNKYFDEILYFFQANPKYEVVLIEDLDRFNTCEIFLKLRELNFLLNESKVIKQPIIFVYAVKDDIFINEDRTKFFDYMITVTPVINSFNSKDKLKQALDNMECKDDIPDSDISEIALFITDMRTLINIVHEYKQYKERLSISTNRLNPTKLLAMITYKNYHPDDFALLHKGKGKIYQCFAQKEEYQTYVTRNIDNEISDLRKEKDEYETNTSFKANDLRFLYLCKFLYKCDFSTEGTIAVLDGHHNIETIANSESHFEELFTGKNLTYFDRNGNSYYLDTEELKVFRRSMDFDKRMQYILRGLSYYKKEMVRLETERQNLRSLTMVELIKQYNIQDSEAYKKNELSPMMDLFIQLGYIDEDFFSYISFFYEGMITTSDRNLLISMKRKSALNFDYPINCIANFAQELRPDMFKSKAILNNDLLGYLVDHNVINGENYFQRFMQLIETEKPPLEFLAQYCRKGYKSDVIFSHFINWDTTKSLQLIEGWDNEEKGHLRFLWWINIDLSLITNDQIGWLSKNYYFLSQYFHDVFLERGLHLASLCKFQQINSENEDILDFVIEDCRYDINCDNLLVVIKRLTTRSIKKEELNLTRILETNNTNVIRYIKNNIGIAFSCFSKTCKNESGEALKFILTNENIVDELKEEYLIGQVNRIKGMDGMNTDDIHRAIRLLILEPSWNVISLEASPTISDEEKNFLFRYVAHYSKNLKSMSLNMSKESEQRLFDFLFSSNSLDWSAYNILCSAFKQSKFDGNPIITNLKEQRLHCLIKHGKIPFTERNNELLKESSVLHEYMKYHNKKVNS